MTKCRIAGDELVELFSLGDLYVSDFIKDGDNKELTKGELTLAISEKSGLVQLTTSADFDTMYKDYWYSSGTNESMTNELEDIVKSMVKQIKFKTGEQWLDIGCNDGTLLSFVPDNLLRVGIDPSNRAEWAKNRIDVLIPDYFTADKVNGKFKFITAIAMFYDLENPLEFLNDIYEVLEDDGLFVVQMSYLPLMLEQLAFDNICHEHLTYYSLEVLNDLFISANLEIVDCQINDANGGSFRVYAQKNTADPRSFGTAPFRDVANFRVLSTLNYEAELELKNPETYREFFRKILDLKSMLMWTVNEIVARGETIWGYGASTKGNTLLQYFGLDNTLITGIAERQPIKYGKKTVGTNIPIYSEREMREEDPDYLLILPWHFVYEFQEREKEFLKNGGKFIVPCPKLEVIGND